MDNADLNQNEIDKELPEVLPEIIEFDRTAEKIDTNRIPKPVPAGEGASLQPHDHPLTDETISIKKPVHPPKPDSPISFDDLETSSPEPEVHSESEVQSEPERRLKIFCYNCTQKLDLTDMEPFSKVVCPSCDGEIIVPKWWDNYLLEESCGLGGMAVVYRGLDLALDREVAIKILNPEIANDEDRNKLFLHEARTSATLNHYAILPIYTCGEFEEQAYFVMQYMGGGSLEQELSRIQDNPLPVSEAIKWLKDISEGLDNARRHGIIHHDIKPGNFMLDQDRNVKIGDFGISQALHDSRSDEVNELTKHWGSPEYVSPEKVVEGKETYLGDIYSLGASFYHLLTGETPFDNSDTTVLLKAKTVKDPIEISKLREDIPKSLAELIMKMMARTPEARPSYRDIVAELNLLSKSASKKKKATTGKQQKNPVATKNKIVVGKTKNSNFDPVKYGLKKKSLIQTLVKIAVIIVILIGGYYVYDLYSKGELGKYMPEFIAKYFSGKSNHKSADYLPGVTQLIREGKSVQATELAENSLDSPLAQLDEIKQAALQMAICTYLNNEDEAQNKCSVISERLIAAGADENSPEVAIIQYLSNPSAEANGLRKRLINDNELRMAGEIAAFVKEIYQKGDDKDKRAPLRNYASLSSDVSSKSWVFAWGDRVQKWIDWIFSEKGDKFSLEPLIRIATKTTEALPPPEPEDTSNTDPSSLQIKDITQQWLNENRSFADKRPKPENFAFNNSGIKSYVASLQDDIKSKEINRVNLIMEIKKDLCKMMFKKPYKGSPILLKSGKSLKGEIIGNRMELIIKSYGGARERVKWDELYIDQFVKLLYNYAKAEEVYNKRKAADEYLRIAVLCDWYGRYKNAVTFLNKAVEADSGIESKAVNLFD